MTTQRPHIDPSRPKQRIKPLKAWGHMRKLIADKEDTAQVFHIIESLNGNSLRRDLARFYATPNGATLMQDRRPLADVMDNHAPIEALPANTVGRAYLAFMQREGLTANGLVEESLINRGGRNEYNDDLAWYANRLRDTHDLDHVLSGYGRDALGEASLLAFSHIQHGGMGINFIAYMGNRQIRKFVPREADIVGVKKEARANGKAAARVADQDIEALLREPLDDARKRMNIAKPVAYKNALRIIGDHGIDYQTVAA